MRRLVWLLPLFLLLGAKPVPVSHLLGWDYAAVAPGWVVAQCTQVGKRCFMQDIAAMDDSTRTLEVAGLDRQRTYCWQVRRSDTGQLSNIVCSS